MKQSKLRLWSITWPIYVQTFLSFSVFFADTFFLSRISDEVAGSVGSLFPVFGMCALFLIMMAQGGTAVSSQHIGAKKQDLITPIYMTMLIINLMIGVVITFVMFLNSENIGTWLGLSERLNVHTTTYLQIFAFNWIFFGVRSAYAAILSSRGLTYWNMWTAVAMNITNVALNYIFLTGQFGVPNFGVAGIALATVVSGILSVIISVWLVHGKMGMKLEWQGYAAKFKKLVLSISRIGVPSALEPVIFQGCQVIITLMIVRLGVIAMGAKMFTSNVNIMGLVWCLSIAVGNQILVAHMMGARNFSGINKRMHKSMFLSLGGSFIFTFVIYLFAKPLLSVFTHNPDIIKIGKTLLLITIFINSIKGMSSVVSDSLKGCGDAKFVSFSCVLVMIFIFLPLAYLFGIQWRYGLVGMWFATLIDEAIRFAINYGRWRTRKWERKGVVI